MKLITFAERMQLRPDIKTPKPSLQCCRKTIVQELDEGTQTLISVIKYKTIDRREEMKPYKVSDFAISNLIAIGADLQPSVLQGSQHFSISSLEKILANMPAEDKPE